MAIDYDVFIRRFPEFLTGVKRALVVEKLAEAEVVTDRSVFGEALADQYVGYVAADLLSMSPEGQHARLIPSNAKATRDEALTTYERKAREIRAIAVSGFRVVGKDVTVI